VKVTTLLYLVLRLRMCGVIPPLPNTSSWHNVYSSIWTPLPLQTIAHAREVQGSAEKRAIIKQ
jgi:hypothetical protein